MINFNGKIISSSVIELPYNNRAFSYGDAVFDTCKFQNGKIQFLEDHYFRLMASMRMLRMEISKQFTLEYFESSIIETIKANNFDDEARVKFTVFRNFGGLYEPLTNEVSYLIEVSLLKINEIVAYEIDVFKDYYVNSSLLSTLKTNNRILNVVASIYASENKLNSCLLLNEKKNIVEAIHGNVFLVKGNKVTTPALNSGCIKGIMRKHILEMLRKFQEFIVEETAISTFDLQKADAIFITNSIIGIQGVKIYKKKRYNSYFIDKMKTDFDLYLSEL